MQDHLKLRVVPLNRSHVLYGDATIMDIARIYNINPMLREAKYWLEEIEEAENIWKCPRTAVLETDDFMVVGFFSVRSIKGSTIIDNSPQLEDAIKRNNIHYLSSVYIHPDYQHQGLGTNLLSWVYKICTNWKIPVIAAIVGESNDASYKLHRNLGFGALVEPISPWEELSFPSPWGKNYRLLTKRIRF